MNNQQKQKKIMTYKVTSKTVLLLTISLALSACSLSKPGDKSKASILNDSNFQTLSIKKRPLGSSTRSSTASDTPPETVNPQDQKELASANHSSGDKIKLGDFFNTIAPECEGNEASHQLVNVAGKIRLNTDAVETLLEQIQKEKGGPNYNFDLIALMMLGNDQAQKVTRGPGELNIQWLNYCKSSSDDTKIHGWITSNTKRAKTAYVAPIHNTLKSPSPFSLAWAQHHLLHSVLSINPAYANETPSVLDAEVFVYKLINSNISADKKITAEYVETSAVGNLPESLQLKFNENADDLAQVDQGINGDDTSGRITFSPGQWIIPLDRKTRLEGKHSLVIDGNTGKSKIYMDVNVLAEDGIAEDKSNFFTWIQEKIRNGVEGVNSSIIVNKGEIKAKISDQKGFDPSTASTGSEESPEEDGAPSEDNTDSTEDTSTNPEQDSAESVENQQSPLIYQIAPWLRPNDTGSSGSSSPRQTRRPSPRTVNKPKATVDPSLPLFEGTSFTDCDPDQYNMVQLVLSCSTCMKADLKGFGWEGKTAKDLDSQMNEEYLQLKNLFGKASAENLLVATDGIEHKIDLCFNKDTVMGMYTDAYFDKNDTANHTFFKDNAFSPVEVETINGEPHLIISTERPAFYTSYPQVVNDLKVVAEIVTGVPVGETLFYQLINGQYATNAALPTDGPTPSFPAGAGFDKFARSNKKMRFALPLNNLANRHQSIESLAQVHIGAGNVSEDEEGNTNYPQSILLDLFKYEAPSPQNNNQEKGLKYLIAGNVPITKVSYKSYHKEIYEGLGASIIASTPSNPASANSDDPVDMLAFQSKMEEGSGNVSTAHPGDSFKQEPEDNFNTKGSLIQYETMLAECQSYTHRFAINLKGYYTTVHPIGHIESSLDDKASTFPEKVKQIRNNLLKPIRRIANNKKRAHWKLYVCSNSLNTGILNPNSYQVYLDTLPDSSKKYEGVYRMSTAHSNLIMQASEKQTYFQLGLDLAFFNLHGGKRIAEYLAITDLKVKLALPSLPPNRMTFQFTGQATLRAEDLEKLTRPVDKIRDFYFVDTLRRLPFTINPIDAFTITTNVRKTSHSLEDQITLYKNSVQFDQGDRSFPIPSNSFDGFLQSFGELNDMQFGFWLEG